MAVYGVRSRSVVRWTLPIWLGMAGVLSQTTQLPDSALGIYIAPNGDSMSKFYAKRTKLLFILLIQYSLASLATCGAGLTYTTEDNFAYCCPSTVSSCDYVTVCEGTSADWNQGGSGDWYVEKPMFTRTCVICRGDRCC